MSPDDAVTPRIDAYHPSEKGHESYEAFREDFEWEVPEEFNTATYVCDRWAEHDPDRVGLHAVAVDGSSETETFEDLRRAASQLADFLAARGVGEGDRVAVNGTQKAENLVTHLAAWKLGAMSVPLSILLGEDGLRFRLQNSDSLAYVADVGNLAALRAVRDDVDALETVLVVDGEDHHDDERPFWDAIEGHDESFGTATTDPEDPATMIYTSGTTGEPKGVLLAHRSLLGGLPGVLMGEYNMAVEDDDVSRVPVEWSWIGSLHLGIFSALFYGVPVVADADSEFDPERELSLIDEYDVTFTGGPATAIRMMTQSPAVDDYDLSSVRVIVQGGEPLGEGLVDAVEETFPNATIQEVYGQTEALLFVADCEALGLPHRTGRMGMPVPGHEVRIQDTETGEPLDTGEVGEIALKYDDDPLPFLEYWKRPEKTEEKVQDGWLRSEDLGVRHEDGSLSFETRKDDVIISSGYKMGPTEIEESLTDHEAVANAGVIGVPDDTRGEIPKAFVVLAPGHEPSDELGEELQNHVRDTLAQYQYPRALEFIDELPKTTTGKVRRHDLRAREGVGD
jgi:acetyl-CoA synthetase